MLIEIFLFNEKDKKNKIQANKQAKAILYIKKLIFVLLELLKKWIAEKIKANEKESIELLTLKSLSLYFISIFFAINTSRPININIKIHSKVIKIILTPDKYLEEK